MATDEDVASFYATVIRSVIGEIRQDFINLGVDEQTLVDLQMLWEQKLLAAKVFDPKAFPVTHRDVSVAGGFSRESLDFAQLRPPTMQQAAYNQAGYPIRLNPIGGVMYPPAMPMGAAPVAPPRPAYSQLPPVNPQMPQYSSQAGVFEDPQQQQQQQQAQPQRRPSNPNIPQFDGADDDAAEDKPEETPSVTQEVDELGSDLDDDSDVDDETQQVADYCLCLYEKVNRTRNRWKCNFRAGIIYIEGREYAFSRLNGDFEW